MMHVTGFVGHQENGKSAFCTFLTYCHLIAFFLNLVGLFFYFYFFPRILTYDFFCKVGQAT